MISKIDISNIIRGHISTFIDYGTNRPKPSDFFLFFGIPPILSLFLLFLGADLNEDVADILVTAMSIFAALLFNLLMVIYDRFSRVQDWNEHLTYKLRFLREFHNNVSYAIVVAIATVTFVFVSFAKLGMARNIILFIVFSLSINFIFTLLMVLKRTHSFFLTELHEHDVRQKILKESGCMWYSVGEDILRHL